MWGGVLSFVYCCACERKIEASHDGRKNKQECSGSQSHTTRRSHGRSRLSFRRLVTYTTSSNLKCAHRAEREADVDSLTRSHTRSHKQKLNRPHVSRVSRLCSPVAILLSAAVRSLSLRVVCVSRGARERTHAPRVSPHLRGMSAAFEMCVAPAWRNHTGRGKTTSGGRDIRSRTPPQGMSQRLPAPHVLEQAHVLLR